MAKMAASSNSSSSSSSSQQQQSAVAATTGVSCWPPLSLSPFNRTHCREICRHAEDLEVSGGGINSNSNSNNKNSNIDQQQATILIVQMAALMVLGDLAACRHLWRRYHNNNNNSSSSNNANNVNNVNELRTALEPWWNVAAALLSNRYTVVWEGLQNLVVVVASNSTTCSNSNASSSTAVLPSNVIETYVTEIAHAYRHRLLKKVVLTMNQPSPTATTVSSLPDYYTNVFGFAQASELQDYYQQQSLLMMQQQQQQRSSSTPLTCFLEAQRRNL